MRKSELHASCEDLINGAGVTTALTRKDSGKLCHNAGATGTSTFNLPTNAVPGDSFEFLAVPAYTIVVDPGTLSHVQVGATVGAASKTVSCTTTAGASIVFTCVAVSSGANTWVSRGTPVGTWTIAS